MARFRLTRLVMLFLCGPSAAEYLPMTCSQCFENQQSLAKMCRVADSAQFGDGMHGFCCSQDDSSRYCQEYSNGGYLGSSCFDLSTNAVEKDRSQYSFCPQGNDGVCQHKSLEVSSQPRVFEATNQNQGSTRFQFCTFDLSINSGEESGSDGIIVLSLSRIHNTKVIVYEGTSRQSPGTIINQNDEHILAISGAEGAYIVAVPIS